MQSSFGLIARRHTNFNLLRNFCSEFGRRIPRTFDEYKQQKLETIEQPENARFVRVAIVGCPNAGKSTLLNQLVYWKISAVSPKVHTTRKNVIGVYVHSNTQIEFVDTPGLVSKKHIVRHKLESDFLNDPQYSLIKSDIIAIITDVSNKRERFKLNKGILDLLRKHRDKESILVLNKVDRISNKRELLDLTYKLTSGIVGGEIIDSKEKENQLKFEIKHAKFNTLFERTERYYLNYEDKDSNENLIDESKIGWPNFSRVFMISALHDDGIDSLRDYLLSKAEIKPWLHNANTVTPQKPKPLIIDTIREVCLGLFHQEIPYKLEFVIVMWQVDEIGNLCLAVDILCPEKFLSLIIGPKGTTISTIVRKSRESLCNIFRCDVSLKIAAKPIYKK